MFVLKAHGTCYKRVLQSPDQHSQGPFQMQLPIGANAHKTTSLNVEPRTPYHAFVGRMPTSYWMNPPINFRKFPVMQSGVGDTGEAPRTQL